MTRAALVLLVEDTPELREDLALELRDAGYQVTEAGDGRNAIAAWRQERPDLVICDVQLPDMGGLEVVSAIRAESGSADYPPVIVASAFSDMQLRADAETLGIAGFIIKPVDYASLLNLIARLLIDPVDPG